MNTRLEQDAADALKNYEAWEAFKSSERQRWARVMASATPCTGVWAPTMTEQQKREFDEYAAKHNLPF